MSRSLSARVRRSPPGGAGRADGFTLAELVVVLAIVGLVLAIAVPNLARARVRSILLSQMKQVRQAVMLTRMEAVKGGRQTVIGFTAVLGRPALIAWRDDNGDLVADATDGNEALDPGERVIGRWTFSEKVTVAEDDLTPLPLRGLGGTGTDKGVIFLASGSASSAAGGGSTGSGAFLVTDRRGNRFRVEVQGGSGSVTERMWDGSTWSERFVHWRY